VERFRRPKTAKQKRAFKLRMARLRAHASRLYKTLDRQVDGRTGRPTSFKTEYVEISRALCTVGATDAELAEVFGVSTRTIAYWQVKYPDFLQATLGAKEAFDGRVERQLAQCALGYTVDVPATRTLPMLDEQGNFVMDGKVVVTEEVEVLVRRYIPPDSNAALKWLSVRQRDKWSEKTTVEHSGNITHEHVIERGVLEYLLDQTAGVRQRLAGAAANNAKVVEATVK